MGETRAAGTTAAQARAGARVQRLRSHHESICSLALDRAGKKTITRIHTYVSV
jgi:hypothetical protein